MKFKDYKLTSRWPYLVTALGFLSLLPIKVLAVDFFVQALGTALWYFFIWPLVFVLELEMGLLKIVASYNNFTNEGGVHLGWIALRDLSNMFFILIFLIIAFSTILRIQKYGYQELLRRTLIIAILINFSKTIVGFVIDVVQVVMLTFVSAVDQIMTGGILVAVGLQKFTNLQVTEGMPYKDFIIALLLGGVFVAILVVVMGVMVMMLMMRIVALWIAIVFAPLAFLASIFPDTRSFYDKWLKQLGANLVTGPMLAFFLWLTFSIVSNGNAYNSFVTDTTPDGPTEFLYTSNMVNYIIAIALLLMGIKMAASSGAAGANIAAKGMARIQKTAGNMARKYPRALAMRTGNAISKRMVDRDGNAKGAFSNKLFKTAFYGSRMQKGLIKMQGRNTARINEEQTEEEKYVNPRQRQAFHESSFKPIGFLPEKVEAKEGEELGFLDKAKNLIAQGGAVERGALNIAGLGGAHTEGELKMYRNMVDRDEYDNIDGKSASEAAEEAAEFFESVGDQPRLDKVHAKYANTNKDSTAAEKDLKEGGSRKMLTKEAEGILDAEGQVTEGFMNIIEALLANVNIEGGQIGRDVTQQDKKARQLESQGFYQKGLMLLTSMRADVDGGEDKALDIKLGEADENGVRGNSEDKRKNGVVATTINSRTGKAEAGHNNKGVVSTNDQNELIKIIETLLQTYPDQAKELLDVATKTMAEGFKAGDYNFDDDSVNHLVKGANESEKNFETRKELTKEEWTKADTDWETVRKEAVGEKGQDESQESYDAKNNKWLASDDGQTATDKMYTKRRNLMGHYTTKEINDKESKLFKQSGILNSRVTRLDGEIEKAPEGDAKKELEEKRDRAKKELEYADKSNAALTESPVFRVESDDFAKNLERAIVAQKGARPDEAKHIEKEEIDEDKLDEAVEKKMENYEPAKESPFKDGSAPLSKEDKEKEVREEIRTKMEEKAVKIQKKEQDKEDNNLTKDQKDYDDEVVALRESITKNLKNLSGPNNKNEIKIKALGAEAKAEEKKGSNADNTKITKLLAEQSGLMRLQNVLKRKELGLSNPNNKNLYSRAILKNGTDGSDFSRLEEMDVKDPVTKQMFEEMSRVATVDQQRQILQAGNGDQIKLLAEAIVGGGGKLGKVVTDNLADTPRNNMYRKMHVQKYMQEIPNITIRQATIMADAVEDKNLKGIK